MAPAASGGGLTMDVREKLVELLGNIYLPMMAGSDTIGEYNIPHKFKRDIADHLIANGVTVQEWISVKDRLPKEKVNCIVHYKHAYCDNDGYWAIGTCFYDGNKFQMYWSYKVTHWMPLPDLPKGE